MTTGKTPLGGRRITKEEAYKGLGDPKTWTKFSEKMYAAMKAKPSKKVLFPKGLFSKSSDARDVSGFKGASVPHFAKTKRTKRKPTRQKVQKRRRPNRRRS